jgi:hypothetical protein
VGCIVAEGTVVEVAGMDCAWEVSFSFSSTGSWSPAAKQEENNNPNNKISPILVLVILIFLAEIYLG